MKKDNICNQVEKHIQNYIPMSPEITQTTSFYFDSYEQFLQYSDDEKNNYVYTRGSNPTTRQLEEILAKLEGGEKCKVFGSGMAAISATLFTLLKSGDHALMVNTIYGEAVGFAKYLEKFGVTFDRIDVQSTDDIEKHLQSNTKMIYFESPSSQKFEMLDLEKIVKIARKKDIYTVIDATWASPMFQNPLKYGIDIVIHSLSKYIGGHSDVVGGCVIGSEKMVDLIFENGHQFLGAVSSPMNSWLAIRGLRTLPVRMERLSSNIKLVIKALNTDPRIEKIYHPLCYKGEQEQIAEKYLTGYGSLFALDLKDQSFDKLKKFVDSLEIISIAVSWGGFESLVLPANKGNNEQNLLERGLSPAHIRFYVGLEDPTSIIDDIFNALDKVYGKI